MSVGFLFGTMQRMNSFLAALHSGRVLLMDGAMGTELQRAGIQPGECYELWNLTHPEKVRAIHRAYVEAGAEVLLTNTFQANPAALANHRIEYQAPELCQAGVKLARKSAARRAFVLCDVSSFNLSREQRASFAEGTSHADGLLLETC